MEKFGLEGFQFFAKKQQIPLLHGKACFWALATGWLLYRWPKWLNLVSCACDSFPCFFVLPNPTWNWNFHLVWKLQDGVSFKQTSIWNLVGYILTKIFKTLRVSILLFQLWCYLPGFSQAGMLKNNYTSKLAYRTWLISTPPNCNQQHQTSRKLVKTMASIETCIVLSTINSLAI